MKSIGLAMIVKDEAHIIERCLNSLKSFVDFMLIVDTGSTDNTIHVVEEFFEENEIAGEVIFDPWRDFSSNRSFALAQLRQRKDINYAFMTDADHEVVFSPDFNVTKFKESLQADIYNVKTVIGNYSYNLPSLFNNHKDFYFKGILHEFLVSPDGCTRLDLLGLHVNAIQDSARNKLGVAKYIKDVEVLETALKTETDPFMKARYTFYLAQSYRDCKNYELAIKYYLVRSGMGFWDQEVYFSLYIAALCEDELNIDSSIVIEHFIHAISICPNRAEAYHGIARHCRNKAKYHIGYFYALKALSLQPNGLFIINWIYEYGLLDEFSILAFNVGKKVEALSTCKKLLTIDNLPEEDMQRITRNLQFLTNVG